MIKSRKRIVLSIDFGPRLYWIDGQNRELLLQANQFVEAILNEEVHESHEIYA